MHAFSFAGTTLLLYPITRIILIGVNSSLTPIDHGIQDIQTIPKHKLIAVVSYDSLRQAYKQPFLVN